MNKFDVIGVIGEGAYGIVLKCKNKETGEIVAIKKFKEFKDDSVIQKTLHREVSLLDSLRHPNIVDLRKAFKRKGQIYLVFEFMMRDALQALDENPHGIAPKLVCSYVYQLCLAIDCCHKHGVMHRDIKPENLLINADNTLKLCDFGFARQVSAKGHKTLTDYVATRWYRAPELLLGSNCYTFAVDMWAIGCICAEFLMGEPLFPGESEIDQLFIIQKMLGRLTSQQTEMFLRNPRFTGMRFPDVSKPETLERHFAGRFSDKEVDFIQSLLQMDPDRRLSSTEALGHPYFSALRPRSPQTVPPLSRPELSDSSPSSPTKRLKSLEQDGESRCPSELSSLFKSQEDSLDPLRSILSNPLSTTIAPSAFTHKYQASRPVPLETKLLVAPVPPVPIVPVLPKETRSKKLSSKNQQAKFPSQFSNFYLPLTNNPSESKAPFLPQKKSFPLKHHRNQFSVFLRSPWTHRQYPSVRRREPMLVHSQRNQYLLSCVTCLQFYEPLKYYSNLPSLK